MYLKGIFKKSATKQQGNCAPWESELAQGNMQNIYIKGRSGPRVGDVFGMNILGTCGGQFGG